MHRLAKARRIRVKDVLLVVNTLPPRLTLQPKKIGKLPERVRALLELVLTPTTEVPAYTMKRLVSLTGSRFVEEVHVGFFPELLSVLIYYERKDKRNHGVVEEGLYQYKLTEGRIMLFEEGNTIKAQTIVDGLIITFEGILPKHLEYIPRAKEMLALS